jgi:hypothetical protein
MKVRVKHLFYTFIFLVLVVLAGVIFNASRLLEHALTSYLYSFGAEQVEIRVLDVSFNDLSVSGVFIEGQRDGVDYGFRIDTVHIGYGWRRLLQGQLERIVVSGADLKFQQLPEEPANGSIPSPLSISQLTDYAARFVLPVTHLQLEQLSIQGSLADGANIMVQVPQLELDGVRRSVQGELIAEALGIEGLDDLSLHAGLVPGTLPWIPAVDATVSGGGMPIASLQLTVEDGDAGLVTAISSQLRHPHITGLINTVAGDLLPSQWATAETGLNMALEGRLSAAQDVMLDSSGMAAIQFTGNLAIDADFDKLDIEGLRPEAFSGAFRIEGQGARWSVTAEKPLTLNGEIDETLTAPIESDLDWSGPVPFELELAPQSALRINLDNITAALDAGALSARVGSNKSPVVLSISFSDVGWQQGTMAARFVGNLSAPLRQPLFLAMEGTLAGKPESTDVTLGFDSGDWGLSGDGQWKLKNDVSDIRFAVSAEDLIKPVAVIRTFGYLPETLKLVSGSGSGAGRFTKSAGDKGFSGDIDIALGDLSGIDENTGFSGGEAAGSFSYDGTWRSQSPLRINFATLSPGILIEELRVVANLVKTGPAGISYWQLDELSSNVFGGQVSLAQTASFTVPFSGNKVTLSLSNIQLAEVVALYGDQGVSGNGQLNGVLPVILSEQGISVEKGRLSSSSAGVIAYRSESAGDAVAASHQQLGLTLKLLEDFRYDSLVVEAGLTTAGDMALGLQLVGRNPAQMDGRQVNFNITVEENLYDLLTVLQLSDTMTEKIEKRLNK